MASRTFLAAALVLLVAAIGMGPAVGALIDRFSKESIALRHSLREFDAGALRAFVHDPNAKAYSVTEWVGTNEYIDMALRQRDMPQKPLTALLVTYYSNPRDQVPHTPEVCYVQAGGTIVERSTVRIPTPFLGPKRPSIEARLLRIQTESVDEILVYFFWCNGRPAIDREAVRFRIGLPGARHVYFSKLETVTPIDGERDREAAIERCTGLLAEVLERVVAHHFPLESEL